MASRPGKVVVSEPVGELKFGQVGIANLRLKSLDAVALSNELAHKLASAPQLFSRAPVVVDLSHLSQLPESAQLQETLAIIRDAGMLPVGLAYGTSENDALARSLDLPIFAKFRSAYERDSDEPASQPVAPASRAAEEIAHSSESATRSAVSTRHHGKPVRSGQQVYARGGDLVLTATVGNAAEVIADGSIHVYATLRGKALAGAQGDTTARIYCQDFQAELVSIAGHYRVMEDIPAELRGKAVHAWLDGDKLLLAPLGQ